MTWFWRFFWISLICKLFLGAILPLAPDEAYYWVWSHHLQLSYFDHPPVVSWLFLLGHPLENFSFAVRWPALILGHATLAVWYFLLKELLTEQELKTWMGLYLFSALLGFGGIIVTPDLPLLLFWALSLLFYQRALKSKSACWYFALGISLGLGFCSKYHIVLIVPILLLDLLVEKKWRKINFKFFPLTILTGLLFCSPVLIWNFQNDWRSFAFQLQHGLGAHEWNPEWTFSYLVSQLLFLGPLLLFAFGRGFRALGGSLLKINTVSPWIFFLGTSLKSVVEANWPIMNLSSGFAIIARGRPSRKLLIATHVFWISGICILFAQWMTPLFPKDDRLNERHRFHLLLNETQGLRPLFANSYQMASTMTFESKEVIPKLRGMSRYDFYDELPESIASVSPFYLIRTQGQALPHWIVDRVKQVSIEKSLPPSFEVVKIELK